FACFIFSTNLSAQIQDSVQMLMGVVLDSATQKPLPYANIYSVTKKKGVISNEDGRYSIDISELGPKDTLRFQYIGYKSRNLSIGQLSENTTVYLPEEIVDLNEMVVYGSAPDARTIVENVLEHKDENYKKTTSRRQTFVRQKYINRVEHIGFDYKKNDIEGLNPTDFKSVAKNFPKITTSFSDYLIDIYTDKTLEDSVKVDPIRYVMLKEKDMVEVEQFLQIFEREFAKTDTDEYWKVKTGILSEKLDLGDTTQSARDSADAGKIKVKYTNWRVRYQLKYPTLENDDFWEFLHKPRKYAFKLIGGTRVNGEDVYVIDFEPDNSGLYSGRLYISTNTYALIRADYQYAPGKDGLDFSLFGVTYAENAFSGSVLFEQHDGRYELKYFSRKRSNFLSFDRNVRLQKKRERFLFDKNQKELKVGVDVTFQQESTMEFLIVDRQKITQSNFKQFNQPEYFQPIYVDQFDDQLWKGYSIIEPTKQMKEYRKRKN
ncbi:carboxypeptidase-like regulatory domain-containing protein, partial [Salinivirga cyanobacteriivorans]